MSRSPNRWRRCSGRSIRHWPDVGVEPAHAAGFYDLCGSTKGARAEARAAAEPQQLESLERSVRTLAGYTSELDWRRVSDIRTGHDLLIYGQFLMATVRAQLVKQDAKIQTALAPEAALMKLGKEIERQKSLIMRRDEINMLDRHLRDLRGS